MLRCCLRHVQPIEYTQGRPPAQLTVDVVESIILCYHLGFSCALTAAAAWVQPVCAQRPRVRVCRTCSTRFNASANHARYAKAG